MPTTRHVTGCCCKATRHAPSRSCNSPNKMSRTAGTSTSSWLLKQENKENHHARSHDNLSGVITEKPVGGLGIATLAQAGHGAAPGRRWSSRNRDVLAV